MSESRGGARWFSYLYRTRIHVQKGDIPILNLSLLFVLIGVLCAPWLAVGGLVAALALGYRFSVEHDAPGFASSLREAVRNGGSEA
ncbi:MAG TPA: DUF4342 domain-containing protein [Candidatus Limiplasma stercoravium]|nr:DUF4342 domain-containing protein [Candidatus Limiplasma stercoravium]